MEEEEFRKKLTGQICNVVKKYFAHNVLSFDIQGTLGITLNKTRMMLINVSARGKYRPKENLDSFVSKKIRTKRLLNKIDDEDAKAEKEAKKQKLGEKESVSPA